MKKLFVVVVLFISYPMFSMLLTEQKPMRACYASDMAQSELISKLEIMRSKDGIILANYRGADAAEIMLIYNPDNNTFESFPSVFFNPALCDKIIAEIKNQIAKTDNQG